MAKSKLISYVKIISKEQLKISEKKEAFQFLSDHGITVIKNSNYSKRQENKPVFWMNLHLISIDKDWDLVLNDQTECQLVYIHISADLLVMKAKGRQWLVIRNKPDRINPSILSEAFIDQRSKSDFPLSLSKR